MQILITVHHSHKAMFLKQIFYPYERVEIIIKINTTLIGINIKYV